MANKLSPEDQLIMADIDNAIGSLKKKESTSDLYLNLLNRAAPGALNMIQEAVRGATLPLRAPTRAAQRGIAAGATPEGGREALPAVGGLLGMAVPVPGQPVVGAAGGAGGMELLAQRLYGEKPSLQKAGQKALVAGALAIPGTPAMLGVATKLQSAYPRLFNLFGVFPKTTEFFIKEMRAGRTVPKLGTEKAVLAKGISGELEEAVLAPQRAVGAAMETTEQSIKTVFGNQKLFDLSDIKSLLQESTFAKSPDVRKSLGGFSRLVPKEPATFDQLIKLKRSLTEGITTKTGKTLKVEEKIASDINNKIVEKLNSAGPIFEDYATLSRNFKTIKDQSETLTGLRTHLSPKNVEQTFRRWGSGRFLDTELNALKFLDTQLSYIGKQPILQESLSGILSPAFRGTLPMRLGEAGQFGALGAAARTEAGKTPGKVISFFGLQTIPAFRRLELILTQKAIQSSKALQEKIRSTFLMSKAKSSGKATPEQMGLIAGAGASLAVIPKMLSDFQKTELESRTPVLKEHPSRLPPELRVPESFMRRLRSENARRAEEGKPRIKLVYE